jgi:hypothetical protein
MQSENVIAGWERRIARRQRKPRHNAVEVQGIQPHGSAFARKNVGMVERLASLAGGASLALAGRYK